MSWPSWNDKESWVKIGLVLVVLIGALLRGQDLGKESLWMDEAFQVQHATKENLAELWSSIAVTEAAPPGSYVLWHYWLKLVGTSEIVIRLPSVVFGLLSIVVLFLAARLFLPAPIALLSSLLLATSLQQVLFSQEARLYSLFTFLSLGATYFFLRIFLSIRKQQQPPTNHYFWYLLFMSAAIYTNYLTVFLVVIQTITILWEAPTRKAFLKAWGVLLLLLLLLALPLLPLLTRQFASLNAGLTAILVEKKLPALLAQLGLFFYTLPLLVLASLFFFSFILRDKINKMMHLTWKWKSSDLIFLGGLVAWTAGYVYAALFPVTIFSLPLTTYPLTHSYFLVRHALFLAPLIYVYFAGRIGKISSSKLRLLAVVILLLGNTVALATYYENPTKAEWREATQFIQASSAPASATPPLLLLDKGGPANSFLINYYYPGNFSLLKLTWTKNFRQRQQINESLLYQELDQAPDFWLVLSKNQPTGDYYRQLLDRRYERDLSKEFYQISADHYRKREGKVNG